VIVHVVKPHHPIPLDPDLFLGRIDAATLVAMGYRDARRYLATMDGDRGVGLTPEATRMEEPGVRVFWRERHAGPLGRVQLVAEVPDAAAFVARRDEARLVGASRRGASVTACCAMGAPPWRPARSSTRGCSTPADESCGCTGAARRRAPLGERLRSLRGLRVELREGAGGALVGEGRLEPEGGGLTAPVPLPIVTNAPSLRGRLSAAASFERVMAGELLGGGARLAGSSSN